MEPKPPLLTLRKTYVFRILLFTVSVGIAALFQNCAPNGETYEELSATSNNPTATTQYLDEGPPPSSPPITSPPAINYSVISGEIEFLGMYGYMNTVVVNNPLTNTYGCPTGATSTQLLGQANVDWPLFFCWRTRASDRLPAMLFGGMWGYHTTGNYPNPLSGNTLSCMSGTGFQSRQVYGAANKDFTAMLCSQTAPTALGSVAFGGMWGYVNGAATVNPASGGARCPDGFTQATALGQSGTDWPLHYCYKNR